MNDSYTELLIHRIINRCLIFYYNDEEYILYQPDKNIRYRAEILYDQVINNEKYDEWPRLKDTENTLLRLGLWNMDTSALITNLEKAIENSKVDLYQNFKILPHRKRYQKQIEKNRKRLRDINDLKHTFDSNTLEAHAANIKNQFIICETLKKQEKKVFNKEDIDSILFDRILSTINHYTIDIKDFKELARSQIWKSYWNADKSNVFSGSVDTWTDDQRVLVNISRMYDSVYEHTECPDEDIINNDDALDGWMIHQKRENKKHKKQKQLQSSNPKLNNAQHVYLPADKKEDISDILELNTGEAKAMYEMDQKALKEAAAKGETVLKDYQLPSTMHRVRQELNQQQNKGKQNEKKR